MLRIKYSWCISYTSVSVKNVYKIIILYINGIVHRDVYTLREGMNIGDQYKWLHKNNIIMYYLGFEYGNEMGWLE